MFFLHGVDELDSEEFFWIVVVDDLEMKLSMDEKENAATFLTASIPSDRFIVWDVEFLGWVEPCLIYGAYVDIVCGQVVFELAYFVVD